MISARDVTTRENYRQIASLVTQKNAIRGSFISIPKLQRYTVEVWKYTMKFIPPFETNVVSNPCWHYS